MFTKTTTAIMLAFLMFASTNALVGADPTSPAATPAAQPTLPTIPPSQSSVPTVVPASPSGYLLRLKFKSGEKFVYHMSMSTNGSIQSPHGTFPLVTSTTMVMTQAVEGVRPDGAAALAIGMSNMLVTS